MRRLLIAATVTALLAGGCASNDDAGAPGAAPTGSASATATANASSSSSAAERVQVVAVTDVYGDIARTIGGDRVEVTSIITGSAVDPHSYEATARDQLAVKRADLVLTNGGHYDEFLTRLLDSAGGERTVVSAVAAAREETVDQPDASLPSPHDHGEHGNEHVWYDLAAMAALGTRLGDALAELDPGSQDLFRANAARFRAGLGELMDRQHQIDDAFGGTPVAVTEPVPLFLLADCGLDDQTPPDFLQAVEEGNDVPARTLQETLDLLTTGVAGLLVYNSQTSGPQTDRVREAAAKGEVPVLGMSETLPEGQDYLGWMRANLDAIYTALEGTEAP